MAAKNKFLNAMKMPSIDDMFSSEADRQRESGDLVTEVPLSELHPFVGHPFEVRDDEDMQKLVDSIRENGVLTNLTVRRRAEGGYEIISGHRRFHAAQRAGLNKVKVQVRDIDDDQAIIDMVDSNIQREHISPMEKARAYAMKLEAISRQGARQDLTSAQVGRKLEIDRRDPDGAVTIMQVRNGVNYLCDDYRGPFADRNDKQLIEMAKQLVTAVGVDRIRPHYYTEEKGHAKVHVGKDIHITEWANAPELCSALRFSRFLNRDGQQLFQVRNGQRIVENYADGSRLVKDVQTVDDTHFYVGSRFCHIQQYANQCFKRGCYVEPEHPQPGDKLDRLLIYQIPHYTCEYRFTDYDYAQNKLKATDYRCAYVANMPRDYTPDKCFRDFNYDDRPCANSMPSLSVSDLIVIDRGDKAEALYVDAVGFKDVSRLLPELHDMEVERQEHNLDELER